MKNNPLDQLRRISEEIGKSKNLIDNAKKKLSYQEIENSKIMKLGEQLEIVSQKLYYDQYNIQKLSLNLIPSVQFDITVPSISRIQSKEEISQEIKIAKVESMKFPHFEKHIEQSLKQTRHSEMISSQEQIKSNDEKDVFRKKSVYHTSKKELIPFIQNKYYYQKEQDCKQQIQDQSKLSLIKFDD